MARNHETKKTTLEDQVAEALEGIPDLPTSILANFAGMRIIACDDLAPNEYAIAVGEVLYHKLQLKAKMTN